MDVNISFKRLATALLLFLGFCIPALAQSDPAPIEIGGVTFSGNIRERYEAWNFFEPTTGQNLYGFSGTQIRFGISQARQNYDWNIEFEVPVLLGIPDGAVRPHLKGIGARGLLLRRKRQQSEHGVHFSEAGLLSIQMGSLQPACRAL